MFEQIQVSLTPSMLKLDYWSWNELIKNLPELDDDLRKWLGAWDLWDLAMSPMDDEKRKLLRYGHYIGWFDAQKK